MYCTKCFTSLLILAVMVTFGCDTATPPVVEDMTIEVEEMVAVGPSLCGGCGQIKGSDTCCAKDAATCDKCKLAKGAPGCCKITKGENVALCAKCGQIKGTDVCCSVDAEKCSKCKLAKGSPGCCKIQADAG